MRTLSSTLTATQKSISSRPHPKVEVYEKIGAITRFNWTRLYEGSEDDSFHACCMPGDGSLIRLRVDPNDAKVYRQRVTNPDENSDYSQWTDWGVTAQGVALCSYGATVYAFRISVDGNLYRSESSDNGASFGSWTDMGNIASGTWTSPTGHNDPNFRWVGEEAAYDDDIASIASVDGNGYYLELTFSATLSNKVRIYAATSWLNGFWTRIDPDLDVDVYYGAAWHNIFSGMITKQTWVEKDIGSIQSITKARIKWNNVQTGHGDDWGSLYEFAFNDLSQPDFRLAACFKDADEAIVLYSEGTDIYRRRLSGGSWEAPAAWTNSLNSITGIAVTYMGDWNIVVTGTKATTQEPIVYTCVLGDGYSAAVGSWSSLAQLTIAAEDSNVAFKFPTLAMPDVFRAFFIEAYTGTEEYSRPNWTHSLGTAEFVSNLWREPVPFNLSSAYGLAMCHKSPYVWLTRPDGVWRAPMSAGSAEITDSVLQIKAETDEHTGRITIVLRNDDGRFAPIHRGQSGDAYEAIKLGSELKFSPGYHTTAESSTEHSAGLAHWIRGWEYTSAGGRAEFILHAVDGWGLLEEWKARRQFSWAAGDKNIFQLLNFIFARAGLEFSSFSSSSAVTGQYPAFTINPGESGKTAVLRLLAMVPDVLFFRGEYAYLKNPQASDDADYVYSAAPM